MPATPESQIELLALAIATGSTVRRWAATHGVAERTAYAWAARPECKARVAELRAALIDRAVGRLARGAGKAVKALEAIIGPSSAAPDAVRVAAAKAILASLIDVRTHAELERRIDEMEKRLSGGGSEGEPQP
jgi:hypothetical protein